MLSGAGEAPVWNAGDVETYEAPADPAVRARYAEVRDLTEGVN